MLHSGKDIVFIVHRSCDGFVDEFRDDVLVNLVEEISRQYNIQAVVWIFPSALSRFTVIKWRRGKSANLYFGQKSLSKTGFQEVVFVNALL